MPRRAREPSGESSQRRSAPTILTLSLPLSLRNGAAIHTISALILHLVQTAPAHLRSNINAKILEHDKPKLAEDVEMRDSQQDELEVDNEEETTTALVSFAARFGVEALC